MYVYRKTRTDFRILVGEWYDIWWENSNGATVVPEWLWQELNWLFYVLAYTYIYVCEKRGMLKKHNSISIPYTIITIHTLIYWLTDWLSWAEYVLWCMLEYMSELKYTE